MSLCIIIQLYYLFADNSSLQQRLNTFLIRVFGNVMVILIIDSVSNNDKAFFVRHSTQCSIWNLRRKKLHFI